MYHHSSIIVVFFLCLETIDFRLAGLSTFSSPQVLQFVYFLSLLAVKKKTWLKMGLLYFVFRLTWTN